MYYVCYLVHLKRETRDKKITNNTTATYFIFFSLFPRTERNSNYKYYININQGLVLRGFGRIPGNAWVLFHQKGVWKTIGYPHFTTLRGPSLGFRSNSCTKWASKQTGNVDFFVRTLFPIPAKKIRRHCFCQLLTVILISSRIVSSLTLGLGWLGSGWVGYVVWEFPQGTNIQSCTLPCKVQTLKKLRT